MNDERESARYAARRLEGWLAKIRAETSLAVILGGTCNGLSFARSLGRRRIPTLLLESDRLLGTYTHYGGVGSTRFVGCRPGPSGRGTTRCLSWLGCGGSYAPRGFVSQAVPTSALGIEMAGMPSQNTEPGGHSEGRRGASSESQR